MNDARTISRSDRIGTYVSAGMLAAIATVWVWLAIDRVREVAAGGAIPVEVPLENEPVTLPLGPDGAAVEATATVATVGVTDPAPATLFALYAQPIALAVTVVAGLVVAALFLLRISRGRAFDRGTARLSYLGGAILTVGWVVNTIFTNMTTNGALSAISDYTYEAITFETSLLPAIGVLIIGGVGLALDIGERLQRDTEGLV